MISCKLLRAVYHERAVLMKSFKLFKDAHLFMFQHPLFVVYLFLMLCSAYIAHVKGSVPTGALSVRRGIWELWQSIVPEMIHNFSRLPYAYFILFLLQVLLMVGVMGCNFYILANVEGKRASILEGLVDTWRALIRAPWMMLILTIYAGVPDLITLGARTWGHNSVVFWTFLVIALVLYLVIMLPLSFMQQLAYDKYYAYTSVLTISWNYFRKSFWTIVKFLLLTSFMHALVGTILYTCSMVLTNAPLIMELGYYGLSTYFGLIIVIGHNLIYVQAKHQ